ncbi:MAG TPA: hypothetical protein VFX65_15135 [Candidatus Limnocylindrales bacterium]|nr:hypothetical protein [Candidatus Limnocylindrales bacterium]
MTMHRRPVGRARLLAALAAVVIVAGCLLPWWSVGGTEGLPRLGGNAFDGFGLVVFIVGLATIALVTLPYARERPVGADRWPAYAILAGAGWIALGLRILQLLDLRAFQFDQPAEVFTRGPGLWVAGLGLVMLARAAYDIFREPPGR